VLGGLIGGPVARYLIRNIPTPGAGSDDHEMPTAFEKPTTGRMITSMVLLETIAMISICLMAGTFLSPFLEGTAFSLPTFL
ncbi:sodium/glutamate symporter, partial [Klebsiella oxytoca]